ncbi:MAG: response regulator [candidate division KSB1 bacterium]|nr:response regulator [candidate division KSB1 bacterium]
MKKKARILIIDDEYVIRVGCQQTLEPAGYEVDFAENGIIGLAKLHDHEYDLVILDIMMPQISGKQLIESIRKYDPSIMIIAITGYGTPELLDEIIQMGAAASLAKPFTPNELRGAVQQALARRTELSLKSSSYQQQTLTN